MTQVAATIPRGRFDVGYMPLLDGVRALAVVLVLLYHGRLLATSAGGAVGVTTFFVLSGFLITGLLLREREERGRVDIRSFYGRRGRRLLPALAVVLVVSAALFVVLGKLDNAVLTSLLAASPFANWSLVAGQDLGPLTHVWTLAVEWQFYLAWPLVMVVLLPAIGRWRLGVILIGLALAITLFRTVALASGWPLDRAKYGSDMQADALLVGCAMALLGDRIRVSSWAIPSGIALTLVAAFLPLGPISWPLAITGGALLVLGAPNREPGRLGRWMQVPAIRHIGRLSYGIYLWQFPLLWHAELTLDAASPLTSILVIGASIVLAQFSYWLVEQRRYPWRLRLRSGTIRRVQFDDLLRLAPAPWQLTLNRDSHDRE
jgi:peptidoglycan/LPS O-acetylase OafA/YrhL